MITPAGKKSILTNAVYLKEDVVKMMRSGFGDIYDAERGITEVGFDDDFKPMKFRTLRPKLRQ